jgi:hypothetical protein
MYGISIRGGIFLFTEDCKDIRMGMATRMKVEQQKMNAAECDRSGSRNAARVGGQNIFPMGPEVVVDRSVALD